MAIPSKDEFESAIRAYAAGLPDDLILSFNTDLFEPEHASLDALALIKSSFDLYWSQLRGASRLPAAAWLTSDRFYIRAYETSVKKLEFLSWDEIASSFYRHVRQGLSVYTYSRSVPTICMGVVHSAFDSFMAKPAFFALAALRALNEYFHDEDACARSISVRKQIDKLERIALAGADAQMALGLVSAKSWHRFGSTESVARRNESDKRKIERIAHAARQEALPVRRLDQTARERLLVYRLWEGQRAESWRYSPAVIKRLLLVEGVRHQLDDRAVEIMCKQFKAEKYGRLTARDLIDEGRGFNYRVIKDKEFEDFKRRFFGPRSPE